MGLEYMPLVCSKGPCGIDMHPLLQGEDLGAHYSRSPWPGEGGYQQDQKWQVWPEVGRNQNHHNDCGKGDHHIHYSHPEALIEAAHQRRGGSDQDAKGRGEQGHRCCHQEGGSRPEEQSGPDVLAHGVCAQKMIIRGGTEYFAGVFGGRVGGEKGREYGHEQDNCQHQDAQERHPIVPDLMAEVNMHI